MKALTLARKIAHQEGLKPVKNDFLEVIIWEKTGWPVFFLPRPGESEEDVFRRQLRRAFRSTAKRIREKKREKKA